MKKYNFLLVLFVFISITLSLWSQPYGCPYDELLMKSRERAEKFNFTCPICGRRLEPIVYGQVVSGSAIEFKNGICRECTDRDYWAALYISPTGERSFDPTKFKNARKVILKFNYVCDEGINLYFTQPGICPPSVDEREGTLRGGGKERRFFVEPRGRDGIGVRNPDEERALFQKMLEECPEEFKEESIAQFEEGARRAEENYRKGLDAEGNPIKGWREE
jgi:hypothetical protein